MEREHKEEEWLDESYGRYASCSILGLRICSPQDGLEEDWLEENCYQGHHCSHHCNPPQAPPLLQDLKLNLRQMQELS